MALLARARDPARSSEDNARLTAVQVSLSSTRKGPGDELTSQYPECRRLKMKCDREG